MYFNVNIKTFFMKSRSFDLKIGTMNKNTKPQLKSNLIEFGNFALFQV